jgi:hypothetical protein
VVPVVTPGTNAGWYEWAQCAADHDVDRC